MTRQPRSPATGRARVRRSRWFFFALLVLGTATVPGRGDVIILKDGYTIHGKVGSEQGVIFDDRTGEAIVTRKMGGLNLVDDGPRWTVFSAHYRRVGEVNEFNKFADYIQIARPIYRKTAYPLVGYLAFEKKTDFGDRWQRTLYYRDTKNPTNLYQIEQQIDVLTPHYVRMNSITHQWSSYYLTRELGPELVRQLLATHPDLVEKGKPDVDKRVKIIRFLIQAGWLDEADEEVERLIKDLPAEAKRAGDLRSEIRGTRTESYVAEIERAKEGGRHAFAMSALRQIPKDQVPSKLSLKLAGLRAEYEAATAKFEKAKRYLKRLQGEAKTPAFDDLTKAADFILAEIHLDTADRLDLFVTLAEQAERALKAGRAPLHKPEELLGAAISGWLMGNNSTETNVATARKRLKARATALEYLREPAVLNRRALIANYEQDSDALPFDELEKLISLLPPPDAEKEMPAGPVEKTTPVTSARPNGVNYLLQLPPEYQHGRAYPVLIVLPHGGQRTADVLKRFGDLPARHGYVVAVADWNDNGVKSTYGYSEDEQAVVTDLLRHLRRTLQVDSDRVFLFGFGEGANMALDVAATHPDPFAGVVPMAPSPDWQMFNVFEYWKNFQNLPVYLIVGDRAGDSVKTIRNILSAWMPRGYPALAVSYKGRAMEWFSEELPFVFDWMGRKTRATAAPDLGKESEEYRTVRATANRFYWVGLADINPANLFNPRLRNRQFIPAKVRARITEGNLITLNLLGMKQASIWLSKGMVDFAKPVVVHVNATGTWKKELTPKISVLLEDLYERGDRQRPFVQRIDCTDVHRAAKFAAQ